MDAATKYVTSTNFEVVAGCGEQDSKPCKESDSDISDEEEPSTNDIWKAYCKMYENWLKVCVVNKSLKNKIVELGEENEMFKGVSANWKDLLREINEKIQDLKVKLENT